MAQHKRLKDALANNCCRKQASDIGALRTDNGPMEQTTSEKELSIFFKAATIMVPLEEQRLGTQKAQWNPGAKFPNF